MRRVEAVVPRHHFGQFNDFLRLTEHARGVDQPGGKPHSPVPQRLLGHVTHLLQFLRRRGTVERAAHAGASHAVVPDQRGEVDANGLCFNGAQGLAHVHRRTAAIPRHQGGDAHAQKILRHGLGRQIIGVGVDINESRGDHQPGGVPLRLGGAGHAAQSGDAAVPDGHIGKPRRIPGAVHHAAAADDEIIILGGNSPGHSGKDQARESKANCSHGLHH